MTEAKEPVSLMDALSKVLRRRRQQLGYSQDKVAKVAGLHRTYLSEIESGTGNLTLASLERLSTALESSASELLKAAEDERLSRSQFGQALAAGGFNILLVEDNQADVYLISRTIRQSFATARICVIEDGAEALAYLRRQGAYAEAPVPQLILLDLNLPRKKGQEILEEINAQGGLAGVPLIVLTTSNPKAAGLGFAEIRAFTKPADPDEFAGLVRTIVGQELAAIAGSSADRHHLPAPRKPG